MEDNINFSDNIVIRLHELDIPKLDDFDVSFILNEAKKYEKFYETDLNYDNIFSNNK